MSTHKYTTEELHAFVDGEVSGKKRAAMLVVLSENPELTRQIAEVVALKAAIQESCCDTNFPTVDLDKIFATHKKKQQANNNTENSTPAGHTDSTNISTIWARWRVVGTAAIAASLMALLFSVWLLQTPSPFVALAVKQHHRWLNQHNDDLGKGKMQLASLHQRNPNIYIPDLNANKLRVALVETLENEAIHIGYKGTHSCHLSLFIQPVDIFEPNKLLEKLVDDSRVFTWRANRLDYVLLAVGMDKLRLRLIAEDIAQATRVMQPFDRQTQMALMLNRKKSHPCVG